MAGRWWRLRGLALVAALAVCGTAAHSAPGSDFAYLEDISLSWDVDDFLVAPHLLVTGPWTFQLEPGSNFPDFALEVLPGAGPKLRAKGTVGGRAFDASGTVKRVLDGLSGDRVLDVRLKSTTPGVRLSFRWRDGSLDLLTAAYDDPVSGDPVSHEAYGRASPPRGTFRQISLELHVREVRPGRFDAVADADWIDGRRYSLRGKGRLAQVPNTPGGRQVGRLRLPLRTAGASVTLDVRAAAEGLSGRVNVKFPGASGFYIPWEHEAPTHGDSVAPVRRLFETRNGDGGPATDAVLRCRRTRLRRWESPPLNRLACAPSGDLYLIDRDRIRRVRTDGIIETVAGTGDWRTLEDSVPAGGAGTEVTLANPQAIACDAAGRVLVADRCREGVVRDAFLPPAPLFRWIEPDGTISTVPDDGTGSATEERSVTGLAVGPGGTFFAPASGTAAAGPDGTVWVSGLGHTIATRDAQGQTVAWGYGGMGPEVHPFGATAAGVYIVSVEPEYPDPYGLGLIPATYWIELVAPDGSSTVLAGPSTPGGDAGDEGPASQALFSTVDGACVGPAGDVYFLDATAQRIRRIDKDGVIHGFAGAGRGDGRVWADASVDCTTGWCFGTDGSLWIASDNALRRVEPGGGTVRTLAIGDIRHVAPAPEGGCIYLLKHEAFDQLDQLVVLAADGSLVRTADVPLRAPTTYPKLQTYGAVMSEGRIWFTARAGNVCGTDDYYPVREVHRETSPGVFAGMDVSPLAPPPKGFIYPCEAVGLTPAPGGGVFVALVHGAVVRISDGGTATRYLGNRNGEEAMFGDARKLRLGTLGKIAATPGGDLVLDYGDRIARIHPDGWFEFLRGSFDQRSIMDSFAPWALDHEGRLVLWDGTDFWETSPFTVGH